MTENSGPFDTTTWNEIDWALAGRMWLPDSVNGLLVSAGGGMVASVASGEAWVRGFGYRSDAAKPLTHGSSTGTAGQSRNDIIVCRLDRTANSVTTVIVAGSFAVTPVDPAISRTDGTSGVWDVPIARVNVVANAAAIGTITDLRPLRNSQGIATRPTQHLRVYRSGTAPSTGAGSLTILWNSVSYDFSPYGSPMYVPATGIITVPEDGLYEFGTKSNWLCSGTASDIRMEVQSSTGTVLTELDRILFRNVTANTDRVPMKGADRIQMSAGDTAKFVFSSTANVMTMADITSQTAYAYVKRAA